MFITKMITVALLTYPSFELAPHEKR